MHRKIGYTTQIFLIYSFKLRPERARKWGFLELEMTVVTGMDKPFITVWLGLNMWNVFLHNRGPEPLWCGSSDRILSSPSMRYNIEQRYLAESKRREVKLQPTGKRNWGFTATCEGIASKMQMYCQRIGIHAEGPRCDQLKRVVTLVQCCFFSFPILSLKKKNKKTTVVIFSSMLIWESRIQ